MNFNFQFRGIFKKGEPVLEGVWEKVDGNGDQISIGPMGVFLTAGGKIRYKTNTHNRPGATGSWQDLAGGLTYISSGKLIIFWLIMLLCSPVLNASILTYQT